MRPPDIKSINTNKLHIFKIGNILGFLFIFSFCFWIVHLFLKTSLYLAFSLQIWEWLYFPGGSDGKASAYNVGDARSIPGLGRYLEKKMAAHFRTLAWKIPWTEKCGRLQSMGSQRIGHDWATSLSLGPKQQYFLWSISIVWGVLLKHGS